MSRIFFTENERNIIQLLRTNQNLSKSQLAEKGKMSWATVVKMTNRLLSHGIITAIGVAENKTKPGKKELLYSLSANVLLAIGIDVEYSRTRLVLINLKTEVFAEDEIETPQNPTVASLQSFLLDAINMFLKKIEEKRKHVIGIGIGLPGIVIPAWLKPDSQENRKHLQDFLSTQTRLPITIEINARSSTNYLKWNNPFFTGEDFMFVSIRTGVGLGIIFHGELLIGHQFIGGEIGHFKVSNKRIPCRCGGHGCLESFINQSTLYHQYRTKILKIKNDQKPSWDEIIKSLPDLFSRAASGEKDSYKIVSQAAHALGKVLSYCLLTIYIPNIIVGGAFGEHGDIIIPIIEKEFRKSLLQSMEVNLKYISIDKVPFDQGDALMAINSYLNA